jgi:hypothetical protein
MGLSAGSCTELSTLFPDLIPKGAADASELFAILHQYQAHCVHSDPSLPGVYFHFSKES